MRVSVNSTNLARILLQITYYFYTYFQMFPNCDGEISFSVPTGPCTSSPSLPLSLPLSLPPFLPRSLPPSLPLAVERKEEKGEE